MKRSGIIIISIFMIFCACDDNNNFNKLALLFLNSNGYSGGHNWTLMNDVDTTAPTSTVKLVFIHHSTGGYWLQTDYGNLGQQLNANNYYVSETDYGWDPSVVYDSGGMSDEIGDHTDTENWQYWFSNSTVMNAVFDSTLHSAYNTNTMEDPTGKNTIIMFKSCFPNSEVGDSIDDEKVIYNNLLSYFAAYPEKMFVFIVPPPMRSISHPALTRELANWLVDSKGGWLASYTDNNVYVFDYYNVLTNPKNHHRIRGTVVEHVISSSQNTLYYPTSDDHPSSTGHQKATAEFVPLLNACYNKWTE